MSQNVGEIECQIFAKRYGQAKSRWHTRKLMFNFTNNQNYKFQALSGTHFAELSLQNLGTEKSFSYCLRERASYIYVDKIDPTQGARNTCFFICLRFVQFEVVADGIEPVPVQRDAGAGAGDRLRARAGLLRFVV